MGHGQYDCLCSRIALVPIRGGDLFPALWQSHGENDHILLQAGSGHANEGLEPCHSA
jgi:hypothetical protein